MNKEARLESLKTKLKKDKKLPLFSYRTENGYVPVLGDGNADAQTVFVGEAPGKNEAKTGKPFCGAAGKILDSLLQSVKLSRADIYITNIVNDRPPENRDPFPAELKAYAPYLDQVLETIEPKVIATLGRFSMEYIMRKFGLESDIEVISQAHGKKYKTKTPWGEGVIIPLYHPAASIYNQKLKDTLKEDFRILKKFVK
jgi:uracil-DNA glycosylase